MNQTNQPPIQPVKVVVFEIEFVQALANYLGTRPYQEVFQFINKIQEIVQAAQAELQLGQQDKDKKE